MIGVLVCLLIADPGSNAAGDLDARIAASAAAAERLQGALDGAWVLRDGGGAALMRLEIEDPPPGSGQPSGAWSLPDGSVTGSIETIEATRERLRIEITSGERLTLRRESGRWIGRLTENGRVVRVTLERR